MNQELERLAAEVDLLSPGKEPMRLAFGYACTARIRHLLEDPEVVQCLQVLCEHLRAGVDDEVFRRSQGAADRLANRHRGSESIDGCGHAAVSASYAVAHAINGRALQAASYSAYATVYAAGGYGAVAQREAFEPEFLWQLSSLRELQACRQNADMSQSSTSVAATLGEPYAPE